MLTRHKTDLMRADHPKRSIDIITRSCFLFNFHLDRNQPNPRKYAQVFCRWFFFCLFFYYLLIHSDRLYMCKYTNIIIQSITNAMQSLHIKNMVGAITVSPTYTRGTSTSVYVHCTSLIFFFWNDMQVESAAAWPNSIYTYAIISLVMQKRKTNTFIEICAVFEVSKIIRKWSYCWCWCTLRSAQLNEIWRDRPVSWLSSLGIE